MTTNDLNSRRAQKTSREGLWLYFLWSSKYLKLYSSIEKKSKWIRNLEIIGMFISFPVAELLNSMLLELDILLHILYILYVHHFFKIIILFDLDKTIDFSKEHKQ